MGSHSDICIILAKLCHREISIIKKQKQNYKRDCREGRLISCRQFYCNKTKSRLNEWFSTFSGPSPGKMNFLSFVPGTISSVLECPSNRFF